MERAPLVVTTPENLEPENSAPERTESGNTSTVIATKPAMASETGTALSVREATTSDLNALMVIEQSCFVGDRLSKRSFRDFLKSDRDDLLIVEQGGSPVGYALVIYRRGTSVARLYSIAVMTTVQGRGAGARLITAAEQVAYDRSASVLRLEVREDNHQARGFYDRLGYRSFGRIKNYYEDGADALRLQKWLTRSTPEGLPPVKYYAQTTDFTCGPAAALMAMQGLSPDYPLTRTEELRLWREATTIYMLRGHGGCDPLGLSVALARRGFGVALHRSEPGPHFLDSVRTDAKRTVMRLVQSDYAEQAGQLGIAITNEPLSQQELLTALDAGAMAIVLLSHYRLTGTAIPHWVTVYGHDGKRFYVHDPWIDDDEPAPNDFHGAALPIPFAEFERLSRYGRNNFRSSILVTRPTNP